MSKQYKSPFATAFKNAVKRGTSYNQAVWNIATRSKKNPQQVWESLYKAGHCNRQKFNGQWIYWPSFDAKFTASTWKAGQFNMWQWFCEWCITSGWCTPEQFQKNAGSQAEFMSWCKKFFGKQFSASTPKAKSSTKTARKSAARKTTARRPKAKPTARKATGTKTAKRTTKRSAPKRTAKKRAATKRTAAKRTATKRTATKRTATKRTATKAGATKSSTAKRTGTKATGAKRTATKRATKTASTKRTATKRGATKRSSSKSGYKFPTTTARRTSGSKQYRRAA